MTCSETDIILILNMATSPIKEIVAERIREKYGSLYRYAKSIGKSLEYLSAVLAGRKPSRPLIFRIAKDLNMPELCYLYEEMLEQRRVERKKKVSTKEGNGR